MNYHQPVASRLIVGAIIALVVVLAGQCEANGDSKSIQTVLNKLESYALGSSGPSSGLTIPEIEEAYGVFQTMVDRSRLQMIKFQPLMQLVVDFVFLPMEHFHNQIGDSQQEHDAYIRRLELSYKRFRPSYLGQIIGQFVSASRKTNLLVDALLGLNDPQPLTLRMAKAAKLEHDTFKQRVRDIIEFEDVYASLDELERYRNYFMRQEIQILAESVLPLVEGIKEEDLPALKELYLEALRKKSYGVQGGRLVKFIR